MCLIFVAWQVIPQQPLLVLANRDEFHQRPTVPAHFWSDAPELFAGRDGQAGGTWLGVTRSGRFAAVTNIRDPASVRQDMRSRGELVTGFLTSHSSPQVYGESLTPQIEQYNGFNLLFGTLATDNPELYYQGSLDPLPRKLPPGIYGLSNHRLDSPWPKVASGKRQLGQLLKPSAGDQPLLELMQNRAQYPDEQLPQTGVPLAWERLLSARFICTAEYGTRSSTLLRCLASGHVAVTELSFTPEGEEAGRVRQQFTLEAAHAV